MDLIRANTLGNSPKAEKTEKKSSVPTKTAMSTEDIKPAKPKDNMAKSLEQAAELTERQTWTGAYGRKNRGVVTNAEGFKKEAIPEDDEFFQDLLPRKYVYETKKPGSKIDEDDLIEIKSYDSEDSLDKMDESILDAPMPEGFKKE